MSRFNLFSILLTAGIVLGATHSASAQSGYTPSRPTLSPWFGLYQKNTGPLDPYHYFVRPRMEAYDAMQQQGAAIQQQQTGLQSLGQEVTQFQTEGRVQARPTGSGSVFMSYSHYYPSKGPGGRTAPAAASRRANWTPQAARTSSYMSGQSGMSAGMSAGRGF